MPTVENSKELHVEPNKRTLQPACQAKEITYKSGHDVTVSTVATIVIIGTRVRDGFFGKPV